MEIKIFNFGPNPKWTWVRCAHNGNDGMMEYWNDGMAPFGQINACGGIWEGNWFCRCSALIKSFCGGRLNNEGRKVRRLEGEKIRSSKMRLKASIPCVQTNSNELSGILHFGAFTAVAIHLKKPSIGPKGLIGPPCHGAPGRRRH